MKFSNPVIVTALAAATTTFPTVQGWSLGPSYFPAPLLLEPTMSRSMLQKQRSLAQRMFDQAGSLSSPRYELVDDNEKFQLSVDVPGVKEEDLDISLDENFLTVKGQRVATTDSSRFSSKFSQTFSLDPSVDVDKFTATLNNGVLIVSAPKDIKKLEETIRRIPITSSVEQPHHHHKIQLEAESEDVKEVEKAADIIPEPKMTDGTGEATTTHVEEEQGVTA
jgi:HSP20 family protein